MNCCDVRRGDALYCKTLGGGLAMLVAKFGNLCVCTKTRESCVLDLLREC